mmetsp:Transcript_159125/g.510352  ORF Transcript_159125/g.510352 Transcript_159125/m.510352 type:complete len:183 (+) Transcript_159125:152-700(+)
MRQARLGLKGYTALIRDYGKQSAWQRALDVLSQLRHQGPDPNTITCNATLGACATGVQWQAALRVLRCMLQQQEQHCCTVASADAVRPDSISFNTTLVACARGYAWAHALDVLRQMLREGPGSAVRGIAAAYSSTASACGRALVRGLGGLPQRAGHERAARFGRADDRSEHLLQEPTMGRGL